MLAKKKRNRTRTACIPCQIRKRKCSGNQPCTTCTHLRSDCQYDHREAPTRLLESSDISTRLSLSTDRMQCSCSMLADQTDCNRRLSSIEANSGAAFAHKLGLKVDPNLAPKLNMFAWNLGLRQPSSLKLRAESLAGNTVSIRNIISQDEMRFLAAVYFDKVDPYYPFLDRDQLFHQISQRWVGSSTEYDSFVSYEGILGGVAALGSLFSRRESNDTESQIVELTRLIIESSLHIHTPSIDLITAWVLRVSYLRIAGMPHLAWIGSCTLMHLIEAAGLHMEPPGSTILTEDPDHTSTETGRKLFGIARHFNLWLSFELGRTRITFPTATTRLPCTSHGTKDIFSFLALSEALDPEKGQDVNTLEQALVDIMEFSDLPLPMILTQCNLMLCVHRRLQYVNVSLSAESFDRFMRTARQGLHATQQMVLSHSPWHQVANVPFQIVCASLAIDDYSAVDLLREAIQTLRTVATSYDTEVMREARNTALLLVKLYQRRKDQDAKALNEIIQTELLPSGTQSITPDVLTEANLADQSNDLWIDDAILNLQDSQLDPLLMMDRSWTTTFDIG